VWCSKLASNKSRPVECDAADWYAFDGDFKCPGVDRVIESSMCDLPAQQMLFSGARLEDGIEFTAMPLHKIHDDYIRKAGGAANDRSAAATAMLLHLFRTYSDPVQMMNQAQHAWLCALLAYGIFFKERATGKAFLSLGSADYGALCYKLESAPLGQYTDGSNELFQTIKKFL